MNTVLETLPGWEVAYEYLELRRSEPDSKIRFCTFSAIACFLGFLLLEYLAVPVIPIVLASATILPGVYIVKLVKSRPCKASLLIEPEELIRFPAESKAWLNSIAAKAVGPMTYGDIDRAILECAGVAYTNRCAARSDELLRMQRAMLENPSDSQQ